MTTIFQSAGVPGVGTHVLIVGVGAYTHLNGGSQPATDTRGLGQLTSPPASAKAMIEWFLSPLLDPATAHGFRNTASPLASLEALIAAASPVEVASPGGPGPTGAVQVEGATLQQIRDGFERWRARLIGQPGSTGIFYFCGHGVGAGVQYLLCQDLLRNEGLPWENTFEVEGTLLSLGKDAPDCHVHFWIDACRDVAPEILLSGQRPPPLRASSLANETVERSHSLLQATGEGRLAFAKPNNPSRFTLALLKSLSGYAGSKRFGGPWQLDAAELAHSVRELLRIESKSEDRKQYCSFADSGDGTTIVQLSAAPQVELRLDLAPDAMRQSGQIYIEPCDGASPKQLHPCKEGSFSKVVPRGIYHLGAEAPDGSFQALALRFEPVNPPVYDYVFAVLPP